MSADVSLAGGSAGVFARVTGLMPPECGVGSGPDQIVPVAPVAAVGHRR